MSFEADLRDAIAARRAAAEQLAKGYRLDAREWCSIARTYLRLAACSRRAVPIRLP